MSFKRNVKRFQSRIKDAWQVLTSDDLTDGERAEAVGLATLKAVEANARIIIKQNGLLTHDYMATLYRAEGTAVHQTAKALEQDNQDGENDVAIKGLNLSAHHLFELANNLEEQGQHENKD